MPHLSPIMWFNLYLIMTISLLITSMKLSFYSM